jgi:hypothetical protein
MATFKILQHPAGQLQSIKQGWSWPAFFFGVIWLFVVKLWAIGTGVLIGLIVLVVTLPALAPGSSDTLINAAAFAAWVVFGLNGNEWREKNLLSRGFELKDTVEARNNDEAAAIFLKKQ